MTEKELLNKIAVLESKVDYLETELSHLDTMLVSCGFSQGVQTLKETISEIMAENPDIATQQKNPNSIDLL